MTMRTGGNSSFSTDASRDGRLDGKLLNTFGNELTHLYRDTLQAPLPAGLRSLIERLEAVLDPATPRFAQPVQLGDRGTR